MCENGFELDSKIWAHLLYSFSIAVVVDDNSSVDCNMIKHLMKMKMVVLVVVVVVIVGPEKIKVLITM